jgi:hypothetical protein
VCAAASTGRAQGCDTLNVRTAPPGIQGKVIRTVTAKTDAPVALPIAGVILAPMRRTTAERVVRRQLLFAAGQPADSARVAETLRRLRDQRLYADVMLTAVTCTASDSVDLTVTTRDAWTLIPVARVVPPSTVSLGIEDRNILGTGRRVGVSNDQTTRGHGGSFSATDPWLLGSDVVGSTRFSDVAGAHVFRASIRHRELSDDDPWRAEIAVDRERFAESSATERPLGDFFGTGHLGRLASDPSWAIVVPYIGGEVDNAQVMAIRAGDANVSTLHTRRFVGADVGLMRQTARFDTVSWFAPHRGFLDVPVGFEGDALVSLGRDRGQDATAARFDGWLGEVWIPARGTLIVADGWVSGFLGNVRPNHVDRLAISAFQEATRGYWAGHASFEQMLLLDSDLRRFSLTTIATDPSLAAVPAPFRLADRATYGSFERAVHLRPFGRASMLDLGLFGAGSVRWDAPATTSPRLAVAVTGLRLRVLSANGNASSFRVDIGYPVASSGSVVRRPLLSVTVTPLLDAVRQRDGRRREQ